jgi:hypothetical protein
MTKRDYVVFEYKKNQNVNRTHLAKQIGFSRRHVIKIINDYIQNPYDFELKKEVVNDFIDFKKHEAIQKLKDLRTLIDQQINELESC